MTEPLDSAKVMAAHQSRGVQTGWPLTPCLRCGAVWPCLPYRLAADLAEANRLAEVRLQRLLQLVDKQEQVRNFAKFGAVTARARGQFELERRWVDLLHIVDQPAALGGAE